MIVCRPGDRKYHIDVFVANKVPLIEERLVYPFWNMCCRTEMTYDEREVRSRTVGNISHISDHGSVHLQNVCSRTTKNLFL